MQTSETVTLKRFTLDDEPIENLDEFLMQNDFDSETVGLIWTMEAGESLVLGGGASADFTLTRVE